MIARLLTRACDWLAARRPSRTFHTNGDPYLTKVLLFAAHGSTVSLHRFHRPDIDRELHSHPWKWAVSLILVGGYREDVLGPDKQVWSRVLRPGAINIITHETFHRVDELLGAGDTWTLFIAGPKHGSWGFLDPETRTFTPWREFVGSRESRAAVSALRAVVDEPTTARRRPS